MNRAFEFSESFLHSIENILPQPGAQEYSHPDRRCQVKGLLR